MEIFAAVVGVIGATANASGRLRRLCNAWEDAPSYLFQLRDDLGRVGRFFDALQAATRNRNLPSSGVSPSTAQDLVALIQKGHHSFTGLCLIVDELLTPPNGSSGGDSSNQDPLQHVHVPATDVNKWRRLLWLKRAEKIKKFRAELRQTMEDIGVYLSLLNITSLAEPAAASHSTAVSITEFPHQEQPSHQSDPVNHVDESLMVISEQIDGVVDALGRIDGTADKRFDSQLRQLEEVKALVLRALAAQESWRISANTSYADAHLQARYRSRAHSSLCRPNCSCSCHNRLFRHHWETSWLSWNVIGTLRIAFSSTWTHLCDDLMCQKSHANRDARRRRLILIQYKLPDWLSSAVWSLYTGEFGSPEPQLRVSRRISERDPSYLSTIFGAIDRRNLDDVKAAIVQRPFCILDTVSSPQRNPLQTALHPYNMDDQTIDFVRVLIHAGVDPYHEDKSNGPVGISAVYTAFLGFLARLPGTESFPDIFPFGEMFEDQNFTRVHLAVCGLLTGASLEDELRHPKTTEMINSRTSDGMTPLHFACISSNATAVKILIRAGADRGATCLAGLTPLDYALRSLGPEKESLETLYMFLEAGASLHSGEAGQLGTPIMWLCDNSQCPPHVALKVLDHLLRRGGGVNEKGPTEKMTPLQCAANINAFHLIPPLVRYGADIEHQDCDGDTALDQAIISRSHESAAILLQHGANYRLRSNDGQTILHTLARGGDGRLARILDAANLHGLDVEAIDNDGNTAVDVLRKRRDVDEQFHHAFLQLIGSISRRNHQAAPSEGLVNQGNERDGDSEGESEFYDAVESF